MLPEKSLPRQEGDMIHPALSHQGIQIISLAYFRSANEAAAVRAPIANSVVVQFIKNIQWKKLDYLLIDFPPGTGDIQLTLSQQADLRGALLVTTPQEVALLDVRKAAHLFEQTKIPLIGIVENMSYYASEQGQKVFIFGQGGGKRLAEELGTSLLAEIPIDPEMCKHGDAGTSLLEGPYTPSSQAFEQLAMQVAARTHTLKQESSFTIQNIVQNKNTCFTIYWSDGKTIEYKLSDLQKRCPCAGCKEKGDAAVEKEVGAIKIQQVGRYALKIQFSSGCSMGIYSYEMLRDS
jgi:ATP-binding protein involved in chromosome partitioning